MLVECLVPNRSIPGRCRNLVGSVGDRCWEHGGPEDEEGPVERTLRETLQGASVIVKKADEQILG